MLGLFIKTYRFFLTIDPESAKLYFGTDWGNHVLPNFVQMDYQHGEIAGTNHAHCLRLQ